MNPLLTGPIVPTLVRLATPGIALALFQIAVSVADTYYIGRLGTESLAGLALVFPMLMLLQMTSAGAMGGGVSSAVARALGAGNPDAARKELPTQRSGSRWALASNSPRASSATGPTRSMTCMRIRSAS